MLFNKLPLPLNKPRFLQHNGLFNVNNDFYTFLTKSEKNKTFVKL